MAPSNHQTFGFKTLKGKGSRLVRDIYDDGDVDDWLNVQAKEGVSGWKEGILFVRTYAYQHDAKKHLYRVEALYKKGLVHIAFGHAEKSDDAWRDCYARLKAMGIMPVSAPVTKTE